jgi:2-phospho-L-lactate guanylyltransferase
VRLVTHDPERRAVVLVAIKERTRCKTRLAARLSAEARLELVRSMLTAVLSAAAAARTVRQIIVVSPERDTVPADYPVLADTGECLNSALTQAQRMLLELGCAEVVVLPADLPNVAPADIDALVHAGRAGGCAIAPDTAGSGTNALCLVGLRAYRFQFGPDSRRLHVREAERMGLSARAVHLPGLEFDVDSPADLDRLEEHSWRTRLQA